MAREFSPIHRAPVGGEYYVFRDAIHNLIEIESAEDGTYVRKLLQTPELQRLRRIRQNGLSSLVYPSIETTRFPHALGSFYIARRISDSLVARQPHQDDGFPECLRVNDRDGLAFSVAALLHDIGHGPLSHVWEECWAEPRGFGHDFHERMGRRILADGTTEIGKLLSERDIHPTFANIGEDVIRFLSNKHHLDYLLPLLEGNLDVDRLDFTARDTRSAGVTYGFHDLEWIIRSLRFARLPARYFSGSQPRWVIAIDGRKGLSTLVQFLHARENMYRLVYYHKTTRTTTRMLALLFKRASNLASKSALTCQSNALRAVFELNAEEVTPTQFLKLDDSDIWSTIKSWAETDSDPILSDLSRMLLSRDLFKTFLLSEDVYTRLQEIDSPLYGYNLRTMVKARLNCAEEDAEYYYAFDSTQFDVIGRSPDKPWQDVWIMESGALGFQFQTLRQYWKKEVRSSESWCQYSLLVHPKVVQDLAGIVARLSFPADSAKKVTGQPSAPHPYRVVAPLGSEGAWKQVYVGTNTEPGSAPENIVALKRYKTLEGESTAIERDVKAINLLSTASTPHEHLSNPRLLRNGGGETWIMEPLWTGSLEDMLKKHGPRRDILEIVEIAEQLFSGLAQLHHDKLRHTDIKPDNCGVLAGSGGKKYVLGDFGCLSSSPDKMPNDVRLLGTLRTRAPEVIASNRISLKADVWSMAATIYAVCLMQYPFVPFDAPHHDSSDRAEREEKIRSNITELLKNHQKKVRESLPPVFGRILKKCFENEEERLSAQKAFEAFRSIRSKLSGRNESLFRTAWQRAEDIVQRFEGQEPTVEVQSLSEAQRNEIEEIIKTHKDFVPLSLKNSLSDLLGKK